MSVLYKALQKAEKENEQRQPAAAGFDPGRLAGSGAIKLAGGRGINWRTAGLAAAVVLAVAIAAAFFLVQPPAPSSPQVAANAPAAKPAPGTTETIPVLQPPPAAAPEAAPAAATPPAPETQTAAVPASEPAQQQAAAAPATPTPAAPAPAVPAPEAPAAKPAPAEPEKTEVAAAPPPAKPAAAPAQRTVTAMAPKPKPEPMPDLAPDSPARMLQPPIAVSRNDFELSGVGNAVRVREVSQQAQNNVSAGYNALVAGQYDSALGFYDRALKEEPTSVLALLGRGSALQKLGRREEAQAAYNQVLKADPANREALSNLTVIVAERSPAEALNRLLELEKEYPAFSPLKAQIGLNYAKTGSMEQALDYLRRAVSLSPEAVMYQYNMALVLDHLGRREQAVASYETVLAALAGGRGSPELSSTDIERRVRYLRVQ